MRRLPSRGAWLAALGASLLVAPVPSDAQRARTNDQNIKRPEVTDLEFRGVRAVEEDELRKSIVTSETECRSLLLTPFCWFLTSPYFVDKYYLDREELRRDVLRLRVYYWKVGFREAAVDTAVIDKGDDEVHVVFTIAEGPPTPLEVVRVLRPEGILSDRTLRRAVKLRAGQPYNMHRLDTTVVALHDALWDNGYADAEIEQRVLETETGAIQVTLEVSPGARTTVGEITVNGNEEVGEGTIRNSLTFREGDLYRREELLTSQRNLYESNLFARAVIEVPPQEDSSKHVAVNVREAPLRETRVAGGFSTVDFVQVEGRFRHYHWLDGARRLEISGGVGNLLASGLSGTWPFREISGDLSGEVSPFLRPTWQASAEVLQRWFRSAHNSVALSLFAHRRSAPGVFIDRSFGTSATFTRMLAPRATASANYRFEISRVEAGDVYFCVNFGICEEQVIEALGRRHRLSPFALTSQVNRSNDPFAPSRGYRARADLENASALTLSDFRYNRASAEGSAYRQIGGERQVLAAHLRLGWVRALGSTREALGLSAEDVDDPVQLLHPRKRFYAGGAQSVRGFGENQLGPRVLTISPGRLAQIPGCDTSSVAGIAGCDPNARDSTGEYILAMSRFQPRPVGGNSLIEGSVEYRFPIWGPVSGAVFVDGAIVGEGAFGSVTNATSAVTPGAGVRFKSPVGPIRVDLGYNPFLAERLPVLTQIDSGGERQLVRLGRTRIFHPEHGVLNRVVLHLSIGEAY